MLEYLLHQLTLRNFVGFILLITGLFDALKYRWNSQKIRQAKTAQGHSRKFINMAIVNDLVRIVYAVIIRDAYIFWVSVLASICMFELFWTIYQYYPYKRRKLPGFKKPSLMAYTINSVLPNNQRKRL
jgi:hypothetical protein